MKRHFIIWGQDVPQKSDDIHLNSLAQHRADLCCSCIAAALFLSFKVRRDTGISILHDDGDIVLSICGDTAVHLRPAEQTIASIWKWALVRHECKDQLSNIESSKLKCTKGLAVYRESRLKSRLEFVLKESQSIPLKWDKDILEARSKLSTLVLVLDEYGVDLEEFLNKKDPASVGTVIAVLGARKDVPRDSLLGLQETIADCNLRAEALIRVSLGETLLLSSHCIVLVHHYLDKWSRKVGDIISAKASNSDPKDII